ncbi:MAG: PilZ domain-containing protein [Clostridiales bacterium]|nr:PilZ domain-containing protein [Clostridiales bacterium]
MDQSLYLMLDSKNNPIARGKIQGKTDGPYWQIQVEDGKIDEILEHKRLKLLSIMDVGPSYEGTIVRSRNDMIQLEVTKLTPGTGDMRKNLRVVVRFKSFIYPVSGYWRGRREIESNDLSCGGIAFFTDHSLQIGERLEVVIPVTSQPLVVTCEILRQRPTERTASVMYAGKFLNLCNDEETLLRESVFNLQLRGRPRPSGSGA